MTLEEQIRSLYSGLGEWDAAGVDRVSELAALLRDAGVQSLGEIAVNPAQYNNRRGYNEFTPFTLGEDAGTYTFREDPNGPDTDTSMINPGSWSMGGQSLGFLGDVNRDGSMGNNRSGVFQFAEDNPMVAWSSRGKGNVSYRLMQKPDGSYGIAPVWGSSSDMGEVRDVAKLGAGMAALVAGGGLLQGLGGAGGAAAAANAPISTAGLAGAGSGLEASLAALNATAAATPTVGGLTALGGATGGGLTLGGIGGGGGLAGTGAGFSSALPPATSLGTTGLGTAQAGSGLLGTIGRGVSAVNNALGGNLGGLVGAVGGALSSKDQTATSSREPWGPAQPWLKDMIAQGQQLSQQYRDNPFSSTQQQAYGNLFGLLNQFNGQMAPGLLSNINAMRVGGTPVQAPQMGLLSPTFRVGG